VSEKSEDLVVVRVDLRECQNLPHKAEGASNPDKLTEAFTRAIPLALLGQTDNQADRHCVLRQRRCEFHRRPGGERLGRADNEG
jgi:hypothetical protein